MFQDFINPICGFIFELTPQFLTQWTFYANKIYKYVSNNTSLDSDILDKLDAILAEYLTFKNSLLYLAITSTVFLKIIWFIVADEIFEEPHVLVEDTRKHFSLSV